MSDQVMSYVVKGAAKQLGITEDKITLETIVPNIHKLALFGVIELGKHIQVSNIQKEYTVEEAIIEFEK